MIEAQELRYNYGPRLALAGVTLQVAAGEIVGVVGADGAGKSTLLRLVVGQLRPDSGTIRVLGHDPAASMVRGRVAYMPQGFGLYQDLAVQENMEFFADLHGLSRSRAHARIIDLLERTGLRGFETRRAGQLSGGMMQKLALACALVSEPHVMVLDEPTTGVDPVSRRAFWRLLETVKSAGITILYATANMDEAERCDRVVLLAGGRVARAGTPLELAQRNGALVAVTGTEARHRRAAVATLPGVRVVFPVGLRLNVWLDTATPWANFTAALREVAPELDARRLAPTLHDTALRDLFEAAIEHG